MHQKTKGKRPIYLETAHQDKLLAMVLALAEEVSVLRERLDTIEIIAKEKGLFTTEEIDTFELSEEAVQERRKKRQEYIARILNI